MFVQYFSVCCNIIILYPCQYHNPFQNLGNSDLGILRKVDSTLPNLINDVNLSVSKSFTKMSDTILLQ